MTLAAALLLALAGDPKVTLESPTCHVAGAPFRVRLALEAPADGARLEGWQLAQTAFRVDGEELGERARLDPLELRGGERKTLELDLGPFLKATSDFELGWGALPPRKVRMLEAAPKDAKFMDEAAVPTAELARHWVLLRTNRGDILVELWPDVAPNHARNFLDLSATGFYDGTTFHRVMPGFMIQGGDPDGSGGGRGPRMLTAEFNARKHQRGVLSMARSNDPNSASCQFFVMHADSPQLDGQYSAFGKVVQGLRTVDRIAKAPGRPIPGVGGNRPNDPQVIERAIVVRAPAGADAWREE
jgi:cyclophilin family peptidyl-prolyl cis-trans isomerase